MPVYVEKYLEWFQVNPSNNDNQYYSLNNQIFEDENNMILLSETMKHHDLCSTIITN